MTIARGQINLGGEGLQPSLLLVRALGRQNKRLLRCRNLKGELESYSIEKNMRGFPIGGEYEEDQDGGRDGGKADLGRQEPP